MTIDSGGSVAIKGFNYQKAVIAYLAVLNYQKDGFQIIIENQDDAEVFAENNKFFIQIKSEKLSLTKIDRQDKNTKRSILGKLLDKNFPGAAYKIVTTNKFSEADKKHLEKVAGMLVPCDVFKYSLEQQQKFEEALKVENLPCAGLKDKIGKSFLVISPFEDKLDTAVPFLLGVMSDRNICIDGNKGRASLTELFTQIDIKSEIDPNKHQNLLSRKELTKANLDKIFVEVDKEAFRSDLRKEILDECTLPKSIKFKVIREFFNLYTIHRSLRRKIAEQLEQVSIDTSNEAAQVKTLCDGLSAEKTDKSILYAIIIDILLDKILEHDSDC